MENIEESQSITVRTGNGKVLMKIAGVLAVMLLLPYFSISILEFLIILICTQLCIFRNGFSNCISTCFGRFNFQ